MAKDGSKKQAAKAKVEAKAEVKPKGAPRSKKREAHHWEWVEQPNDTAGWQQLDASFLIPPDLLEGDYFAVWGNRFKSSSPDCEAFIHDPLGALLAAGIAGVNADARVVTSVLNHDKTLSRIHLFAVATISPTVVGVTMYKIAEVADGTRSVDR